MLGLALAVAIAGACWVAAEHRCLKNIPSEIWFVVAALGGVLVGAMIPFSINKRMVPNSQESPLVPATEAIAAAGVLAAVAAVAGAVGALESWLGLCGFGVAMGGVFLGLFIPAPGRRDP